MKNKYVIESLVFFIFLAIAILVAELLQGISPYLAIGLGVLLAAICEATTTFIINMGKGKNGK